MSSPCKFSKYWSAYLNLRSLSWRCRDNLRCPFLAELGYLRKELRQHCFVHNCKRNSQGWELHGELSCTYSFVESRLWPKEVSKRYESPVPPTENQYAVQVRFLPAAIRPRLSHRHVALLIRWRLIRGGRNLLLSPIFASDPPIVLNNDLCKLF